MRHILVKLQPFVYNQSIEIYSEKNNLLETHFSSLGVLDLAVLDLCKKQGINEIDIRGPIDFAKKIQQRILGTNNKFEKLDLNINLV